MDLFVWRPAAMPVRAAALPSLAAALAGLLLSGLAMAESGTLLRDSELRAKPFGDAEVLVTLEAKDTVEIVARQSAWAQVKSGGKSGWVRLLNVRTGSGQRGDAGVGALASVFKTGSSGNTVTTGVKGLSEERLSSAEPNPEEAKRLNQYRENEAGARAYARQVKLTAQSAEFFDAGGKEISK
jgi:hypothetical protein